MEIENKEILNKIRTDSFMNQVYRMADKRGLSEAEMLRDAVILLLHLKDEAFQEKVDKAMRSTKPMFASNYFIADDYIDNL